MQHAHAGLHAGTAIANITPALSADPADRINLSGYVARIGHAVGVHDPLTARALALSDGTRRAMLIVCDLLALEAGFSAEVRHGIAAVTGIPQDAVMLACTHTHSGPATLNLHECGEVSPRYLAALRPKLIAVASRAAAAMQPVRLDVGSATLAEGAYNRRKVDQSIDSEVGIAWLRNLTGGTVALLVNYGCHPVVMNADNLWISADYPGATVRALEVARGGTAFFLTGADGDVDPVRRGSFEDVAWLGETLAGVVDQALTDMEMQPDQPGETEQSTTITAVAKDLSLPLQSPPSIQHLLALRASYQSELAMLAGDQQTVKEKIQRAMLAWADETLAQMERGTVPATITAPVQVIQLRTPGATGSLAFVGIPGELFSVLGQQIKDALPDTRIFIAGYANQDIGYIPDRTAYDEGGYEVEDAYKYYGDPAALAPEAGEMIVAMSVTSVRLGAQTAA